jgi:AcrR family transcriptional regulator
MNTMSTRIRKYELKARAESQRATRARIAKVTAELHEEKGVARTTVAEIARRAGVTRLTVYNHFPELSDLLPACAAHYERLHPAPEFETALALGDPRERVHGVLTLLYAWYRETESMYGNLMSDRASVPELDRFLEQNLDRMLAELAEELAGAFALRGRRAERLRALVRLALDFWTWRRLTSEGVDDATAADVMASAVSADAA